VLLCLATTYATAQEVYTSSGKSGYKKKSKREAGYDPDKLIIGGGFNGVYGGGYASAGVSPIVGYLFFKNFTAGVGVGYQYYQYPQDIYDYNNPSKIYYAKENIIYPGLWARYFVFRNIFVETNFEYDFINLKAYDYAYDANGNPYIAQDKAKVQVPCLLLGVGIRQPLSGRVSVFFEAMYDALQQQYSPYYGQPVFRLGVAAGL
jgi:hypothetical protein